MECFGLLEQHSFQSVCAILLCPKMVARAHGWLPARLPGAVEQRHVGRKRKTQNPEAGGDGGGGFGHLRYLRGGEGVLSGHQK